MSARYSEEWNRVAVTLQGADQGDTTTLDETLCEAGMAVAEQVGREAELRPHEAPQVNVAGGCWTC